MRLIGVLLALLLFVPIASTQALQGEETGAGTYQLTPADTVTAQPAPAGKMFAVRLQDGGQLLGELKRETPDDLTFITSFGEVKIARSKIKALTRIAPEDIRQGEYWYPDPNQTRSFVFPTASTLPKGKEFYENYYLFFHGVHSGASDHAMVSFGGILSPDFMAFTFGQKFQVYRNPDKTTEAAFGAQLFIGMDGRDTVVMFVPYGVVSFGRPNIGRFNLGVGGITAERTMVPLLNLSGNVRTSRHVKLMGELFIIPGGGKSELFPIYGLRFFSEKLAFDLGLVNVLGEGTIFPGYPLVNFVLRF